VLSRVFIPLLLIVPLLLSGCERETSERNTTDTEQPTAPPGVAEITASTEPLKPSSVGKYLSARHAANSNDVDDSKKYFDEVLKATPDAITLQRQRLLLALQSPLLDMVETTRLARSIRAASPDDLLAALWLFTEAALRKDYLAAQGILDGIGSNPLSVVLQQILGAWTQQAAGDSKAAEALMTPAQRPEMMQMLQGQRAYLQIAQGNFTGALQQLQAARQTGQPVPRLLFTELFVAGKASQSTTARSMLDEIQRSSNQAELIGAIINAAEAGDGRFLGMPDSPQRGLAIAFFDIGSAFKDDKSREVALLFARLSLALDAESGFTTLLLSEILEGQNRLPQAIEFLDAVPRESLFWPFVQAQAATFELQLKREAAAETRLKAVLVAYPDLVTALSDLAGYYRNKERFSEALPLYKQALEKADTSSALRWSLYFGVGICQERLKNWPEAEKALQAALELRPDEPNLQNYLAYSWVDQGINLDEALVLLEKAVSNAPNDGYIVDSLGWAHYKRGDYAEAEKYLERAVELRPADPILNDHLGDAYWRVGRVREAYFQWQRALRLKPKPEDAVLIQRKIDGGLDAAQPDAR
jgi:tetratricopeptide (TPR) repeat protein